MRPYVQVLAGGFHSAPLSGMDVCYASPLVATVGEDRRLRVWNYRELRLRLAREFAHSLHCVALHPAGLTLLVGESDKARPPPALAASLLSSRRLSLLPPRRVFLHFPSPPRTISPPDAPPSPPPVPGPTLRPQLRLYFLLARDVHLAAEFPIHACALARFSHGGQYFVATDRSSINLYSSVSYEHLGSLNGHMGPVRALSWSANDSRLASAGLDGAVYEWKARVPSARWRGAA